MNEIKRAQTACPLLDAVANRWSPYAFEPREVEAPQLLACLEAARWAASSFNEQPWSFLIARREDPAEFERMLSCLLETNRLWARQASVLMLTVVSRKFHRNGNPNRMAEHDLGLAVGNLCCQATHLGLAVHQMAGIDLDRCRQCYQIPAGYDPVTAIALGYAADPVGAPTPQLAQRDRDARARKPLGTLVFVGKWGSPSAEVDHESNVQAKNGGSGR